MTAFLLTLPKNAGAVSPSDANAIGAAIGVDRSPFYSPALLAQAIKGTYH